MSVGNGPAELYLDANVVVDFTVERNFTSFDHGRGADVHMRALHRRLVG